MDANDGNGETGRPEGDQDTVGDQGLAPVNGHLHAIPQARLPNGQFSKGNRFGSSRPVDEFVALCRRMVDRYQLVQECARMATGKPPYTRASAEVRLKALELLLNYAFGRPRPTVADLEGMTSEEVRFVYQKRIVGVDQSEV